MKGILRERDVFVYDDLEYRVLQLREYDVLVIQMNTEKTRVFQLDLREIEELLETGVITIAKLEQNHYIDENSLSVACYQIYREYRLLAMRCQEKSNSLEWLLQREEKAEFLKALSEEMDCGIGTARRRLREYLQNGATVSGLGAKYNCCGGKGKRRIYTEGRRPGRKGSSGVVRDEETLQIFRRVKNRYVATKGRRYITILYTEMVQDYYSEKQVVNGKTFYTPYPALQRPSKRQLYYYLQQELTDIEKYAVKHGYRAAWNNIRPLASDTIHDLRVRGAGCRYEMDEMETDYELVQAYDRSKVIGRGILYLVVDVFTKELVGYSVGIDNNSWAGAEMALLNMVEDKVMYCARKNISISREEWPVSWVLPSEITVDNGAEYLSHQFEEFAIANGIHISFTPGAMGSMKGNIEREFRAFNLKTEGVLPGQIVKNAYRQPHLKQARLTIEEFEQIVIRFILHHNKTPMDFYKDTKEIYESGIEQSPNSLWEYSLKHTNGLKQITNMVQYKLSLLCSDTARITREGIVFHNMVYCCEDTRWLSYEMSMASVGRKKKLKIKYDKRCMDSIYYLADDQEYKLATLNKRKIINEKYYNLSYQDIIAINEEKILQRKENEEKKLLHDIELLAQIKPIVKNAERLHIKPNSSKHKRENRMTEKERLHQKYNVLLRMENSVANRFPRIKKKQRLQSDFEEKPQDSIAEQNMELSTEELLRIAELRKYGVYD